MVILPDEAPQHLRRGNAGYRALRPIIQDIWPSSDAPMQDFSVVLSTAGIEVDVRYRAIKDLGAVPISMVLQSLQTRLEMPDLTLKAQRIPPVPVPVKQAPGKH